MTSRTRGWSGLHLLAVCAGFSICAAAYGQRPRHVPPPEPHVRPFIAREYPSDADRSRIADTLEARAGTAAARLGAADAMARKASAVELAESVHVELIFDAQITQEQIDAFVSAGGEIDHLYRSVSYGWNGRIPLEQVLQLPATLGASMVLVDEQKPSVLHMDLATRTGRVRPVWAPGFAGNVTGFSGDPSITIAIIDSGVDGTHADLSGRQQFWKDYTSDNLAIAQDLGHHGSHVAGIALGSGAAGGSATGTLYYTDDGDLSGVASGSFYPSPIGLPATALDFTSVARWSGSGTGSLYLAYRPLGGTGYTAVSTPTTGSSPITEVNTLTPSAANVYTAALTASGSIGKYVIANTVTNYPGVGDGFNRFRGVAPGCNWAGGKVFTNAGSGTSTTISAAIDEMVTLRVTHNIKVMNLSLGIVGNPGIDVSQRQKVNTAVNNGIVVVVSAGNDGEGKNPNSRQVDDPGRAAFALTVAASNDVNALTSYSSTGFSSPSSTAGQQEDYKPDLMAPGGSTGYYTGILSVDSNTGDSSVFADQQPNDYYNIQGTSMASPFAAGCAALVIDALQKYGTVWNFASSEHPRLVKMLLCATATESNTAREGGSNNPTLQRAAGGANSFPAGKDANEGYGMINPDAAVEAVALTLTFGTPETATLGAGPTDRRAWARRLPLTAGSPVTFSLTVPPGADFDLYLYSGTPGTYGAPMILASSTGTSAGAAETIGYTPSASGTGVVVVKRISGTGTFTLSSTGTDTTAPVVAGVTAASQDGLYGAFQTIAIQVTFNEPVTVTGTPLLTLATTPQHTAGYVSGSGTSTLLFHYTVAMGDSASDLDYAGPAALDLNGGTIQDAASNAAILTLPMPGTAGSLGAAADIVIAAAPADLDHDGDVDADDFTLFAECVSGPGVPQSVSACEPIDFDADQDVDQEDFGAFQRCFVGDALPADPACAG